MEGNKKLTETLIQGRNSAKILQNLFHGKVRDDGSVSVDDLVMKMLASFYGGLSILNSYNSNNFSRVPACSRNGNLASFADHRPPEFYNNGKKPTPAPTVKKRRGCYKRRTMESMTIVSYTIEDGYAWRKYGQKSVLNSKFPRCYYRCTHKLDGCKALKQVQNLEDEESNMFHITYFGHHTCPTPQTSLHPHESVICFKDFKNHHYPLSSTRSTSINIHFDPSFEQKYDINVFDNVTSSANRSAATFGSNDTFAYDMHSCNELESFMGFDDGGSYASKSPWDDQKMDLFENSDFLNDILFDDTIFSELI